MRCLRVGQVVVAAALKRDDVVYHEGHGVCVWQVVVDGLAADDLLGIFADVPSAELPRDAVLGKTILDVAAASGLCSSKGEARRLIQQGGLTVNNVRVTDLAQVFDTSLLIEGRLALLRAGKKNNRLLKIV